jgi:hypothetical protein
LPNRVRIPNIYRMIRVVVRVEGVLLGRRVYPGDILCIDLTSDAPVILGAELPRNVGQLLGALEAGLVEAVDVTPDDARSLLAPRPSPPPPPRVLDLRSRLARDVSA